MFKKILKLFISIKKNLLEVITTNRLILLDTKYKLLITLTRENKSNY